MAEPRHERRISGPATRLTGCVATQLDAWGITTCFLGLIAGQAVDPTVLGDGKKGDAVWVRLGETVPTLLSEGGRASAECSSKLMVDVEVGYLTCYPVTKTGAPLNAAQNLAIFDKVMAAKMALYTAISCCEWRQDPTSKVEVDFEVTRWAPAGPFGAAVGGAWFFQMVL